MEITTMSRVMPTQARATSCVVPASNAAYAAAARRTHKPTPTTLARLPRVMDHVGTGTGVDAWRIDTEKFSTRQGPPSCSPA